MSYNDQISRSNADALMPEEATEVINGAVTSSVILSQMTQLPNMARLQERMPVLDSLPQAFFTGQEDGLRQTTNLAWKNKFIVAQEICAVVVVPQTVMNDAGYPIMSMAMPRVIESITQVADAAIAIGRNAPAAGTIWPECMLSQAGAAGNIRSLSNAGTYTDGQGNVFTLPGAALANLYQAFAGDGGCYQAVENEGYENTGWVGTPNLRGKLRGMVDSQQRPLLLSPTGESTIQGTPRFELAGVPGTFARNGALPATSALALGGDMSQAVFSIREDIEYIVDRSGVISDNTGKIVYNLLQQRMVALLVFFRIGWQVPNPPTLLAPSNAVNAKFSSTTRSPFWALVA